MLIACPVGVAMVSGVVFVENHLTGFFKAVL
jgi:Flp pilus assembly pilin Flp